MILVIKRGKTVPKSINWPQEFFEEIVSEDSDQPKIAIRLGDLYFDNGYYVSGDVVDIRVDHKIARKGQIISEMRLIKIKDLSQDDFRQHKISLQNKLDLISHLTQRYSQAVDENTEITVITYKNLPVNKGELYDDPHM